MSVNALGKRSGVGASTIRRILTLSLKSNPTPHTILGILSSIHKEKRISKLIEKCEDPIYSLLKDSFNCYIEEDLPHQYDVNFNDVLGDSLNYLIYKLAANRTGVAVETIVNYFGLVGRRHLAKLLELKMVYQEGDKIFASKKDFSLDLNLSLKHVPELIKFYRPENLSKELNSYYTLSESVNKSGIDKIREIQREAAKEIYRVMNSPFYEGDIPYFTLQINDTLTIDNIKTKKGLLQ